MRAAPESVHLEYLPADPGVVPPAYLGCPYLDPKCGYSEQYRHLWANFDALDPRSGSTPEYGEKSFQVAIEALRACVRAKLEESQE